MPSAEPGKPTESPAVPPTAASAARLAPALTAVHRASRRRIRRELGLEPLNGAQTELLRLIAEHPGTGVSAAARELRLAGNSVSTMVNQLTAAGYLTREQDPADRRAARLTATAAGRERLARWADHRVALFTELLAGLTDADRSALDAAVPALLHLADRLAEAPEGRPADEPAPAPAPASAQPQPQSRDQPRDQESELEPQPEPEPARGTAPDPSPNPHPHAD